MKKIWVVVIAVVCAGVFFYVGMVYGKSSASAAGRGGFTFSSSTRAGFGGRTGAAGTGGTGGLATGQVISTSPNSVTIQLSNGNSQVVFFSSSTQIEEPQTVSASALTNGTNVVVTGSSNSDGSLTAQSIQVRPAGMGGFFGGGSPGGSSTPPSGSQ